MGLVENNRVKQGQVQLSCGQPLLQRPSGDEYHIVFARSARKELEALPRSLNSRVVRRIEALAVTPRPPGSRKLVGSENLWRIRIGDYRVIYGIYDEGRLLDVVAVRHRSDAYR